MNDILQNVLFYSHLIGFAAVGGGLLAQIKSAEHQVTNVMLNGARWQLLSGLALAGIWHTDYRPSVVGVKTVIAIAILGLMEANRKKTDLTPRLYFVALALVLIQVAVALFIANS